MTRPRRWFILMITVAALSPFWGAALAQGAPGCFVTTGQGYASYVHNPGNLGDCVSNPCVQDLDLDFYEYWDLLEEYWISGHAQPRTAAVDTFDCPEEETGVGHGHVVRTALKLGSFAELTGATARKFEIESGDLEGLPVHIRNYEPRAALDGGPDGMAAMREAVPDSWIVLKSGGLLFLEIGADQGNGVMSLCVDSGFGEVEILKDLAGHDRVVRAVKQET